jgi:HSP20 family protein
MLPVRFTKPRHAVLSWDPFREFGRLGRMLDDCFDNSCRTSSGGFAVDVREDEKAYIVEANLPGFSKDAVELTFQDGLLTIEAETKQQGERTDEQFHVRERYAGKVSRSFRLPDDVDADSVTATMTDGVLTVTLQKTEAALPRKIDVKGD